MTTPRFPSPRAAQSAFALVEALVSLVLLSIALGGSTALLVQAVYQERTAGERSRALRHASSLADALRVLRREDARLLQAITEPGAVPECTRFAADCGIEVDAARFIDAWQAAVAADMPSGTAARVAHAPGTEPAYRVSLSWPVGGEGSEAAVRLLVQP